MASRPPHVDAAPAPVKLPRGPGRLADPELQRQAREKSAQVRAARASARLSPAQIAEESLIGLLSLRRECRRLLAVPGHNSRDMLELVRVTLQVESEIADRTAGRPAVAKSNEPSGPSAYAEELRRLDAAAPVPAPDAAPDAPVAPRPMRTLRATRPARRNQTGGRRRAT